MKSFSKILKTDTFKQSLITSSGTIINGLLGLLFYIILARNLGVVDFGLIMVSITTLTLVADIVDFGTNTGLVRFIPSLIKSDRSQAFRFFKLSLEIKLFTGLLILILGLFMSSFIAETIFQKPELSLPLRLSFIGVGASMLFSFATSSLQSLQRFLAWSILNIINNFLRLGIIIILIFFGDLTLFNSLSTYVLLPFFGFFIGIMLLPIASILKAKNEQKVFRKLFQYNIWVAVFTIIAAISARLDIFLGARLLSVEDLGIYSAASQFVVVVPQIVSALGVVMAPKFASFTSKPQMLAYFNKAQLMTILIALLGLLGIPVYKYIIIPFGYGVQYQNSVVIFSILLISMLIFLISVPLHNSIFYYFSYPKLFVYIAIGHFTIIAFLGYYLILQFGAVGAAISVLIGMVFNLVIPLVWFLKKIYEKK